MNTEPYDILILGGQDIPFSSGAPKVRQIPFTLLGLGEAHQLIPACKTLIYCPNRSIFTGKLNQDDIKTIETLFNIAPSELEDNFDKALQDGLRLLCLRKAFSDLGLVLTSGGKLVICFPEDFSDWTPRERGLVSVFMPAQMVTRDDKWMHRLEGPPDLLAVTVEQKSTLVFTVNRPYLVKYEMIFDPDFIPAGASYLTGDVEAVRDRKGQGRIVRMRIGSGSLVLCPELYWNRFLVSVGAIANTVDDKKVAAPVQPPRQEIAAAPSNPSCSEHSFEGSPHPPSDKSAAAAPRTDSVEPPQGRLESSWEQANNAKIEAALAALEAPLTAMLPDIPEILAQWNRDLEWGHGAFRNITELVNFLDYQCAASKVYARKILPVAMPSSIDGKPISTTSGALWKLLSRKIALAKKKPNNRLKIFLQKAFARCKKSICRT